MQYEHALGVDDGIVQQQHIGAVLGGGAGGFGAGAMQDKLIDEQGAYTLVGRSVLWCGNVVPDANGENFEDLGSGYGQDNLGGPPAGSLPVQQMQFRRNVGEKRLTDPPPAPLGSQPRSPARETATVVRKRPPLCAGTMVAASEGARFGIDMIRHTTLS
jgi:hypothetical protein